MKGCCSEMDNSTVNRCAITIVVCFVLGSLILFLGCDTRSPKRKVVAEARFNTSDIEMQQTYHGKMAAIVQAHTDGLVQLSVAMQRYIEHRPTDQDKAFWEYEFDKRNKLFILCATLKQNAVGNPAEYQAWVTTNRVINSVVNPLSWFVQERQSTENAQKVLDGIANAGEDADIVYLFYRY